MPPSYYAAIREIRRRAQEEADARAIRERNFLQSLDWTAQQLDTYRARVLAIAERLAKHN